MRRRLGLAGAALGTTTLWNLGVADQVASPGHYLAYHWSGSATSLFLPVLLDLLIPWILLTVLLFVVERTRRLRAAVWTGVMFSLLIVFLRQAASLEHWNFPAGVMASVLVVSAMAVLFMFACWRADLDPPIEKLRVFVITVLCFGAISGVMVFGEFAWYAWQARHLNAALPLHSSHASSNAQPTANPRIVWIVLDELSYSQVYQHRAPDLNLPAFDALAGESTVFTRVLPAGIRTELVVPSLLMGEPLNKVRFSASGSLSTQSSSGQWRDFDPHDTVFEDALNAGYRTGVAGWYNPYCRILPNVLDSCFWRFGEEAHDGDLVPYQSLGTNMMRPYMAGYPGIDRIASRLGMLPPWKVRFAELHADDYVALLQHADRLLNDPSLTFLLLHLPIPHPPGIYDPSGHRLTAQPSSYIANLALADEYLAHVRALLEQSGQWDTSAVVVMGDHSWRTKLLWHHLPGWTHEEQVASEGGRFDDRPAYIVKLPGQHTGSRIDDPYAAVNTRALFDALMRHEISTPEDLSTWVKGSMAKPLPRT